MPKAGTAHSKLQNELNERGERIDDLRRLYQLIFESKLLKMLFYTQGRRLRIWVGKSMRNSLSV